MRDKISTLFFILATGLILAHIATTAHILNHQQNQQSAVYRILRTEASFPEQEVEVVDYKKLAEMNAETSKAEGW